MSKILIIVISLMLSGCAVNHGFPREISGSLKPINNECQEEAL